MNDSFDVHIIRTIKVLRERADELERYLDHKNNCDKKEVSFTDSEFY